MKYITVFFFSIVLFFSQQLNGKSLYVQSFERLENDLSARTSPRKDLNGKYCALIKVHSIFDDLTFDGEIIGDVKHENGVFWVYVSCASEFIFFNREADIPVVVYFEEYPEIGRLTEKSTYVIEILEDRSEFQTKYAEEYTGINNGYKYVDLGLSVYWAICNVGAESPEQLGIIFLHDLAADWESSVKLPSKVPYISEDGSISTKNDVAQIKMRGKWRIPTLEEGHELATKCTWFESEYKGQKGYIVTGPNGHSLFVPYYGSGIYHGEGITIEFFNILGVIGNWIKDESPYENCKGPLRAVITK